MPLDRYNRPFLLPEHLHCDGLPFEIEAGALLVDTTTDNVIAQLKMVSYADKRVKAVKVTVQPEDTRGEVLGDEITHQYLDLDAKRGESFGQKTPVPMADRGTRSFSIRNVELIYSDNSVVSSDAKEWHQLPEQESLRATIADDELIRQYQIEYGDNCLYLLQELPGLWRCVCGTTNRSDEETCHSCGQRYETLRAIDPETIEKHKEDRLESIRLEHEAQAERERIAKEEAAKAEAEKKERLKKAGIRAAIAATAVAAAFLIASFTIIPASKYNNAVEMMESGDFAEAEAAFSALGDYQDAQAKATECQYGRAMALFESGDYALAKEIFSSLGEYQDSQSKTADCDDGMRESAKTKAAELILQGSYDDAMASCRNSGVTKTTEENRALFAEAERLAIKKAEVGDTVTYGQYANKDLAQWVVINKDEDGAYLLCDLCLFKTPLGESHPDPKYDWSDSDFRQLMNSQDVLSDIFTSYEIAGIMSKEHVYDGNLDEQKGEFKAGSEKKCTDKLFCPSSADILKGVPVARNRISSYNGAGIFWWLSDVDPDPAYPDEYLCFRSVSWQDGSISSWPADNELGVRPAMWVSFE